MRKTYVNSRGLGRGQPSFTNTNRCNRSHGPAWCWWQVVSAGYKNSDRVATDRPQAAHMPGLAQRAGRQVRLMAAISAGRPAHLAATHDVDVQMVDRLQAAPVGRVGRLSRVAIVSGVVGAGARREVRGCVHMCGCRKGGCLCAILAIVDNQPISCTPQHLSQHVALLKKLPAKVKFTGLTQNSQVDPAVCLKIPITALELTQVLGQPCEFQVAPQGAFRGLCGSDGTTAPLQRVCCH